MKGSSVLVFAWVQVYEVVSVFEIGTECDCVHTKTLPHSHTYTHTKQTHTNTHKHTHTHTHVRTHVHTHSHTLSCTHLQGGPARNTVACTRVLEDAVKWGASHIVSAAQKYQQQQVRSCNQGTHTLTHTHTHTHAHTHTHTHTSSSSSSR